MLVPSMRMSPLVSAIRRLTRRRAVVFPPPDGPTSTQISPAGTVSERWSTAWSDRPAYCFVASSKTSSAARPGMTANYRITGVLRDRSFADLARDLDVDALVVERDQVAHGLGVVLRIGIAPGDVLVH